MTKRDYEWHQSFYPKQQESTIGSVCVYRHFLPTVRRLSSIIPYSLLIVVQTNHYTTPGDHESNVYARLRAINGSLMVTLGRVVSAMPL